MTWAGVIRDFVTFQRGIEKRLALTTSHWSVKAQLVASRAFALLCAGVLDVSIWGGDFLLCYVLNDCDLASGFGFIEAIGYIPIFLLGAFYMLYVIAREYRPNAELIVERFYLVGIVMLWMVFAGLVILALTVCAALFLF